MAFIMPMMSVCKILTVCEISEILTYKQLSASPSGNQCHQRGKVHGKMAKKRKNLCPSKTEGKEVLYDYRVSICAFDTLAEKDESYM